MPWLRSGPLYRVHAEALPILERFLAGYGYWRIELDGARMTSREEAHSEIARAFGFPEYYGGNWDAFADCFCDSVAAQGDAPVAVVWWGAETMAATAPATLAEVGWAMLAGALDPSLGRESAEMHDAMIDVFMIGNGSDFDRP